MSSIPWDQPATAKRYGGGALLIQVFSGTLREAVQWVMTQPNSLDQADGYKVVLDDGSTTWEGPEIAELWKAVSG